MGRHVHVLQGMVGGYFLEPFWGSEWAWGPPSRDFPGWLGPKRGPWIMLSVSYNTSRYLHVSSQQNIMVPNSCDNSCFHCAPPLMLTWFVHMRMYRTMESTNSIKWTHVAFRLACQNPLNHCLTNSLPINVRRRRSDARLRALISITVHSCLLLSSVVSYQLRISILPYFSGSAFAFLVKIKVRTFEIRWNQFSNNFI